MYIQDDLQLEELRLENERLLNKKRELLQVLYGKELLNKQLKYTIFQLRQRLIPYPNLLQSLKNDPVYLSEEHWQRLFVIVDTLCPHFRKVLSEEHADLSEDDIKYCCLIYLLFSTGEIAKLMNVLPDSVTTRKKRILKKIDRTMSHNELEIYLLNI